MTEVLIDRLRIRGPSARRLAAVARQHLPAALDRSLDGLSDGVLGRIEIALDFDPDDHDDATLAELWAGQIRAEVMRRVPPAVDSGSTLPGESAQTHRPIGDGPDKPDADLPGWVRNGVSALIAGSVVPPELPEVLRWLSDRRRNDRWAESLAPEARRVLLDRLTAAWATRWDQEIPGMTDQPDLPSRRSETMDHAANLAKTGPESAETPRTGSDVDDTDSQAQEREISEIVRLAELLAPRLRDGGVNRIAHGHTTVTEVAGLVLLYPWLENLCSTALELLGTENPVFSRRLALSRLADPDRPWLIDDPLVRVLAGEDPLAAIPAPPPEVDPTILDGAIGGTLASFAAALPGFTESSPRFLREEWLVRWGTLDLESDPIRLVAERRPLDMVLDRLFYPLGLSRLPWTRTIWLRFEGGV